jgi:L-alanine-DL-glutamate epimerase-like enolase superfamily enzyme
MNDMNMTSSVELVSVEAFAYRVPVAQPIKVAFGTFRDRPFVLVKVTDKDGHVGWGESWANWPAVGAEHRARLVNDFADRIVGKKFASPQAVFQHLSQSLEVLVLQTGEVGPIAQAIAGIDIAIWDLTARKAGLPLYKMFTDRQVDRLPVYATGINPDQPEVFAAQRQAEGHRAFKLKTGFGHDIDVKNLQNMRKALGDEAVITCDSNQSLTTEAAISFVQAIADLKLDWFEEPLRIDAPQQEWEKLARASTTPLAGGENFQGRMFDEALAVPILQVIQPDVTKWGGVTGNWHVAHHTVAAGKRYCPHFFGGGVSLLTSIHLLAAAGGTGMMEFDCHPNHGRDAVVGALLPVTNGTVPVPQTPGLGAVPNLEMLKPYQTWPAR